MVAGLPRVQRLLLPLKHAFNYTTNAPVWFDSDGLIKIELPSSFTVMKPGWDSLSIEKSYKLYVPHLELVEISYSGRLSDCPAIIVRFSKLGPSSESMGHVLLKKSMIRPISNAITTNRTVALIILLHLTVKYMLVLPSISMWTSRPPSILRCLSSSCSDILEDSVISSNPFVAPLWVSSSWSCLSLIL